MTGKAENTVRLHHRPIARSSEVPPAAPLLPRDITFFPERR
jgi:hypothetical protein